MLVVHGHALLQEVQFSEILRFVGIVALGAHIAAGADSLIEENLKGTG